MKKIIISIKVILISVILFTIIGGVGAYFGKKGWILREIDEAKDRPIKILNKWSVFLE